MTDPKENSDEYDLEPLEDENPDGPRSFDSGHRPKYSEHEGN